jgi:hypothetical protein
VDTIRQRVERERLAGLYRDRGRTVEAHGIGGARRPPIHNAELDSSRRHPTGCAKLGLRGVVRHDFHDSIGAAFERTVGGNAAEPHAMRAGREVRDAQGNRSSEQPGLVAIQTQLVAVGVEGRSRASGRDEQRSAGGRRSGRVVTGAAGQCGKRGDRGVPEQPESG